MENLLIKIATDFSPTPGPRSPDEGDFAGSEFRTKILLPLVRKAIDSKTTITVNLDGTAGYGTSFIEESFGGLVRSDHIDYDLLKSSLLIISDEEPEWHEKINEYLKDAYDHLNS